jgi:TRAP-type uncharacterized transport system fused permease subunit
LPPAEIPDPRKVLRDGWPTIFPLLALVALLLMGYTPYLAAFWGITLCVAVCLVNPRRRITLADLVDGFVTGAKYALAVGAAAAVVGIIEPAVRIAAMAACHGDGRRRKRIIAGPPARCCRSVSSRRRGSRRRRCR